jgi:regulator of replication initiation timing
MFISNAEKSTVLETLTNLSENIDSLNKRVGELRCRVKELENNEGAKG